MANISHSPEVSFLGSPILVTSALIKSAEALAFTDPESAWKDCAARDSRESGYAVNIHEQLDDPI